MENFTKEQLLDIENEYDRMFKESRESYVSGVKMVSLGDLIGGEKGAAYADVFPLVEDLSRLMTIQDMEVKGVALKARYKNYPPILNNENKFEFITLCAKPTKFLAENPEFLENYAFISNYIDESIACEHIDHDLREVNKEMAISGLLPQCFEMVGVKNDKKMQKQYLDFLAKYSSMQNEYALASKKMFEAPTGPANA